MSVSVTAAFQDFAGATSGTPLPVNFPVMAITDIFMAKLLVGGTSFINLTPGVDFTRTDLGGGNYEVTPLATYASSIVIRVYRLTAATQPFEFSEGGPLPAPEIEGMGDRLCMIDQETRMLGLTPSMSPPPGTTTVSFGGTGLTALTPYGVLLGGTTNLGAMQQVASVGTAGQALLSNGAGAKPSFQNIPAGGDVVGPAASGNSALAIFDGTSGKLLKSTQGTNGDSTDLNMGDITDASARPLTIRQAWDNAALVGQILVLLADIANADPESTIQEWQTTGGLRAKLMNTGEFRMLDGSAALPILTFDAATGTGIYRDTAGGALAFSVAGVTAAAVNTTVFQVFKEFLVTVGAVDILSVTAAFVKAFAPLLPGTDAVIDLGSGALQWKDLYLSGQVNARFFAFPYSGISVASAATITPARAVFHVTGVAAIATITVPAEIIGNTGEISIIPDGAFTWTNAGNIAIAGNAVVSKLLKMLWDATTGKWYPSYVA